MVFGNGRLEAIKVAIDFGRVYSSWKLCGLVARFTTESSLIAVLSLSCSKNGDPNETTVDMAAEDPSDDMHLIE